MPAGVTHYLVGDMVLKKLEMNFSKKERDAFDLGCQGGDIFFFYQVFGSRKYPLLKKAGEKLHKKLINAPVHYMNVFASTLQDENDRKIIKAYIMGYLCHFSTDTTAHPYIYALSDILLNEKKEFDPFYYHAKIESNLDVIMLLKLKNKTIVDIPPYSIFPAESSVSILLGKMYSFAFEKAGYTKAPSIEYTRAFYYLKRGMKLLYSKGNIKRNTIFNISKFIKITPGFSQMIHPVICDNFCDYTNISKKEIEYNNGVVSSDNFFEIFDKAVNKSADCIKKLTEGKSISDIMEGKSFDTGLIVDESKF